MPFRHERVREYWTPPSSNWQGAAKLLEGMSPASTGSRDRSPAIAGTLSDASQWVVAGRSARVVPKPLRNRRLCQSVRAVTRTTS